LSPSLVDIFAVFFLSFVDLLFLAVPVLNLKHHFGKADRIISLGYDSLALID